MQLLKELEGAKKVGIAGHVRPDGDSIGACIGLGTYIEDNCPWVETVDLWLEKPDDKFSLLRGFDKIRQPDGCKHLYDVFISVDVAAYDRLGKAKPSFDHATKTICIDHHVSNPGYAMINVIEAEASSACEVLVGLMDMDRISVDAAAALYTGIAHDSGVFQYSCTSPKTMRIAADLMEKGIDCPTLLTETYYKKTYRQNQILGKALLESMRLLDGRCIVTEVKRKDMRFFEVHSVDLEGIVSQLRLTDGVEVAIFLHEIGNLEYKISLRSQDYVDVSAIASFFGGGGHVRAAGATMKGTFHDIVNNLTLHIQRQMEEHDAK